LVCGVNTNKMKKAFIAGAICPSCGKEDKIFVLSDGNSKVMQCASCDFKRDMNEKQDVDQNTYKAEKTVPVFTDVDPQVIKWK